MIAAGFAALTAAVFGPRLVAQQPAGGGAPAPAAAGPRIAVVNIGLVFAKYDRAKAFKGEIEASLAPIRTEAETIKKNILKYKEDAVKAPADKRDQYEAVIVAENRKLEDLDRSARKAITQKQEAQLAILWKEVNDVIEAYAAANSFQLVLGYGDPVEPELLKGLGQINRKMNAMDVGSCTPLYISPNIDISNAVAMTLNQRFQAQRPAAGVQQTGGVQGTPTGQQK